ncbi:cyclin D binding myb like transcription factor 1 [Phyllostomus discolor]|uniref:Cyclin D binding myb like transcription factor 1 n=1 Tax=Phyllostomus discolor TaxID=89673 RepID=A0A833Z3R1_9CHIR|nr:cyclin D binding myb like transcription factor 1 [Phyllostomus discolor]
MSTVEEDSDTVTVETVNSVTLTRDTDGNLILHCPQNVSENDQSFEVTMTATTEVTDDDITEGTVTQIQILQNEQLDEISPLGNEEVSAVSQAWFTTKEDKDSLTNKGHKWKQGMWSKEEIDILMNNIERYLKVFTAIFFCLIH